MADHFIFLSERLKELGYEGSILRYLEEQFIPNQMISA
jgi:hypothetical protein